MEVVMVPIKELIPNDKNPRKISQREMQKLLRSIKEFGFIEPIIVNKNKNRFNYIVGGHQRVKAAIKLKMEGVPVTYVDLNEDKEHLLNIALNEISGEWDDDKLLILLKELEERGVDLTLSGLDEPLLDEILLNRNKVAKEASIDKTPTVQKHAKSKKGEVWLLGRHRLMVGDSTLNDDLSMLMDSKRADLCWTDPPYSISEGSIEDGFYDFLLLVFKNIYEFTKEGSALYTCYASIKHITFEQALNEAGFTVKQELIWSKGHILGRNDYHWSHEPILYCRRGDSNTSWYGDRTHHTLIQNSTIEQLKELKKEELIDMISKIREDSDILEEKKDPTHEYSHSTQKPVGLSQRMIKNSTRPKDLVLDPCAGSGSTLMACEVSGRTCYSMEIDPLYADVIIQRWKDYTEKEPLRESDGLEWSKI